MIAILKLQTTRTKRTRFLISIRKHKSMINSLQSKVLSRNASQWKSSWVIRPLNAATVDNDGNGLGTHCLIRNQSTICKKMFLLFNLSESLRKICMFSFRVHNDVCIMNNFIWEIHYHSWIQIVDFVLTFFLWFTHY